MFVGCLGVKHLGGEKGCLVTRDGVTLADGVVIEHVGEDLMVMVPEASQMYRLTGDARDVVLCVQAQLPTPSQHRVVTDELVHLGVLTSAQPNRRSVLRGIGIGAGAGILALGMPAVAAAASPGSDTSDEDTSTPDTGGSTVVQGATFDLVMGAQQLLRFSAPNPGTGTPSALTIANPPAGDIDSSIPFAQVSGQSIEWDQTPYTGAIVPNWVIDGSFEQGGVTYQVAFTFGPFSNQ